MQIMFGTILCVLLKGLVLTKTTITFISKDYTPSNSLQEESVSICPDLNFTQVRGIFRLIKKQLIVIAAGSVTKNE